MRAGLVTGVTREASLERAILQCVTQRLAGGVCAVAGRGHAGEDREGQGGTIQH
jgi:hypothetical protein